MYKYLLFSCLLFTSVISFAANKIQMVTYFPVPYVAYSKVTPKNQLDIGLTSSCQMNLGCTESGYSLNATTTNLNRNRLDLNSAAAVSSTNVTVGSGYGPANIDFAQNLRVGALDRGYSLEANTMNVQSLTLFASHMKSGGALFPDCRAKSGEETVSWQKLKLKNTEEIYLMCGKPKESSVCSPPAGESASRSCPSGYTGTQTRTWSTSTCSWSGWTGSCTCSRSCQSYEKLNTVTCTCEPVYKLMCNPGQGLGLFINNRREMPNQTYTVQLSDTIGVERPSEPGTRWYVNNQYVGSGAYLSFSLQPYAYSANHNEFIISYNN